MTGGGRIRIWAAVLGATGFAGTVVAAEVRAHADVTCRPAAEALRYDCTIRLTNARTNEPLTGVTVTVGADMPTMPMAHNVRPVKATPTQEPGIYQVLLELEMHGDWMLRLDLTGAARDRVLAAMRFEADRATPGAAPKPPSSGHKQ